LTRLGIAKGPCSLFLSGNYLYDEYGFNVLIQAWDENASDWDAYKTVTTNTVLIWARNGVGINTNDPEGALEVAGLLVVSGMLTNDPAAPTHGPILYAKNVGGTNELFVQDTMGNVTQLSSHRGTRHVLKSYNVYTGKGHVIDIEELAKAVAQLTGNTNIYREIAAPTVRDWDEDEARRVEVSRQRHRAWQSLKAEYEARYEEWLAGPRTNPPPPRFDAPEPVIYRPRPMPKVLR